MNKKQNLVPTPKRKPRGPMPVPLKFPEGLDVSSQKDIRSALEAHSVGVREVASRNERYTTKGKVLDPIGSRLLRTPYFKEKLKYAMANDLFLGENCTLNSLVDTYQTLAAEIHGLQYCAKDDGIWVPVGKRHSKSHLFKELRARNYLEGLREGTRTSVSKTDMVLLAHSFGLPVELWDQASISAFKSYCEIERAYRRLERGGKPLLSFKPLNYVMELARDDIRLNVYDNLDKAADAGIQSAVEERSARVKSRTGDDKRTDDPGTLGGQTIRVDASLAAHQKLWFGFPIAGKFEDADCFLLAADDDGAALMMSNANTSGGDLSYSGEFYLPRVATTGVTLNPINVVHFLLIMVHRQSDQMPLASLGIFQNKENASDETKSGQNGDIRTSPTPLMSEEDKTELRNFVLGCDPSHIEVVRRTHCVA